MKKILLVEDEPLIQKTLKMLLQRRGHEVTALSSGIKAIAQIHDENFDLIICDLMLQDITGFDIIEESKAKFSPEDISAKFRIITAYSSPQIIEKAKLYQCAIYSKPFTDVNLVIDNILRENNDAD